MLEIKFVRQNLSLVQETLKNRNASADLEIFQKCDEERREILAQVESLRHRRNKVSQQIAEMKKSGRDADDLVREMRDVGDTIKELENGMAKLDELLKNVLLRIPNIPHISTPVGKDEKDNQLVRTIGDPTRFDFEVKAHWDIGEDLKILDFERASRITGARFPLYFGAGAKLERSLINFMLDIHTTKHGYKEVLPPFIVNRETITNTGQLPKFEEDLFKLQGWDFFLIPTAEVPVTNIHQNEILDEDILPVYYVAYSPCFRSEAGSYGKDTRGLIDPSASIQQNRDGEIFQTGKLI